MKHKVLWFAVLSGMAGAAAGEEIVGLRADQALISFDSDAPGIINGTRVLTGFPVDVDAISIDYRPESGKLVLLASGPTSTECQFYAVNTSSGAVTALGAATHVCPSAAHEFDFDPVNDRARVLSGTQNYRVTLTGVRSDDTTAAFATGDTNEGDTPALGGTAHNRNRAGAAATTVFAIDTFNDALVRVGSEDGAPSSPNAGLLTTIGSLGLDVAGSTPFDISGDTGVAYLFTFDAGGNRGLLHTVNLASGAASTGVEIGAAGVNLLGLTVVPTEEEEPVVIESSAFGGWALVLLGVAALARRRQRWHFGQ